MKSLWHARKSQAFTLVELLVVIAIIAVLAAMLLPTLVRGKQRAQRIECIGNLQELGTAFQIFAHDHQGKFPMQTPIAEGGSMELVQAGDNITGVFYFSYRHLQTLANELVVPRILLCPSDVERQPAITFSTLQNSNVSYFVGVDADYNMPQTILAGDRNITNNAGATASLVRGTDGLRWTSELHRFKGNVVFSDTHVEQLNNAQINLPSAAAANANYFLPAVRTPSVAIADPLSPPDAESSSTPPPDGQPSEPAPARVPASPGSPPPAPSTPPPMRSGMSGSSMAAHESGGSEIIIDTNARETNKVAAIGDAPPHAAPPAIEEGQPPLLWLMGAARALVAKTSWWLLLLLMLLIASALYFYSRRKMSERRRRR